MPIRKEQARLYPADWKLRRRFIVEYRAQNRCEWCQAANHQSHPITGSEVVLTLAHVWDKAPGNASLLNLAALCQRCHNRWDAADRARSRSRSRLAERLRAGQLPLPFSPGVSDARDLYAFLVQAGQITPPAMQLPIPREAWRRTG